MCFSSNIFRIVLFVLSGLFLSLFPHFAAADTLTYGSSTGNVWFGANYTTDAFGDATSYFQLPLFDNSIGTLTNVEITYSVGTIATYASQNGLDVFWMETEIGDNGVYAYCDGGSSPPNTGTALYTADSAVFTTSDPYLSDYEATPGNIWDVVAVSTHWEAVAYIYGAGTIYDLAVHGVGSLEITYTYIPASEGASNNISRLNAVTVPEPCSLGIISVLGLGLLSRRRIR